MKGRPSLTITMVIRAKVTSIASSKFDLPSFLIICPRNVFLELEPFLPYVSLSIENQNLNVNREDTIFFIYRELPTI
jgi:hypothetical protein